jgi:Phosphodiester glycosidase
MPARITPLLGGHPRDGVWHRADRWAGPPARLLFARVHFGRWHAADVAYIAWMRSAGTQLALYPGYKGPGPTSLPRGPEQVPRKARYRLLAVFNSGFYEADARAGFFVNGLLYYRMRRGLATVVAYRDGRVDVLRWQGGDRPGPAIVMARQNLPLFVDKGQLNPHLDASQRWGSTLGGARAVWRTGLGIDPQGNLLYLAAPNQTALSLGRLLLHAGAVRAMQLDINPAWPVFVTYGRRGGGSPSPFVPNPNQAATTFLYRSIKDFFALYLREGKNRGREPF